LQRPSVRFSGAKGERRDALALQSVRDGEELVDAASDEDEESEEDASGDEVDSDDDEVEAPAAEDVAEESAP